MKYEEFAKYFEECRKRSQDSGEFMFTAVQTKQPIEECQEVYDFIFAEDFITREVTIDELITLEPEKHVDNIFVQHII